jgi:hypothetical protein
LITSRIAEAASSSATRHHKQMTASEGMIERDDDSGDDVPRGRYLDVRLPDDLTGGGAGMATFSSTTTCAVADWVHAATMRSEYLLFMVVTEGRVSCSSRNARCP